MSRGYYLSPIIGAGTRRNPWRVAAADFPGVRKWLAWIPSNAVDGTTQNTHAVVAVDMADHSALIADPDHTVLDLATARTMARQLERAELPAYIRDAAKLPTRAVLNTRDATVT